MKIKELTNYNLKITCKAGEWLIIAIVDDKGTKVSSKGKTLKNAVYGLVNKHKEELTNG